MTRQSYGSGNTNYIDFEYDSLDRVVKKSYNGNDSSSISYMYDPNGNLYRTEDKLWNMWTVYEYDLAGRIKCKRNAVLVCKEPAGRCNGDSGQHRRSSCKLPL